MTTKSKRSRTRSKKSSKFSKSTKSSNTEKNETINNIIRVFTVIIGLTGLIIPMNMIRDELYEADTGDLKSFLVYILASPGCAITGLLSMKAFLFITEGIHDIKPSKMNNKK